MTVKFPHYAKILFEEKRYYCLYGGRGSGKSYSVARFLLAIGSAKKIKVLCAREYQNSIADSVHSLLKDQIEALGLSDFYTVTRDYICGENGTEFMFKGVNHNVQSIKSIPGITHLWLEEAQMVSQESWNILIPTIREPGSKIIATFNPENEDDPVYAMFVKKDGKDILRDDALVIKANWNDNLFFPEVLRTEKDYMYETNPDLAQHIWEGECRSHSDAQIFKGKFIVEDFEPHPSWGPPLLGADWGFSIDPTCLIELYIDRKDKVLYVRNEAYERHVELDNIPKLFDKVPTARKYLIRGDNSRPETISHINRHRCPYNKGPFRVVAAKKWPGSVEDGIEFIKSFKKIVIHTSCKETRAEFKNYSYKVNRLTQEVTTDIIDDNNHIIDSIRYALEPMISKSTSILEVL